MDFEVALPFLREGRRCKAKCIYSEQWLSEWLTLKELSQVGSVFLLEIFKHGVELEPLEEESKDGEASVLQSQFEDQIERLHGLVRKIIAHQVPEVASELREEFKLVMKQAYVRNACKFLELYIGTY